MQRLHEPTNPEAGLATVAPCRRRPEVRTDLKSELLPELAAWQVATHSNSKRLTSSAWQGSDVTHQEPPP
jgi:hypothetical protein